MENYVIINKDTIQNKIDGYVKSLDGLDQFVDIDEYYTTKTKILLLQNVLINSTPLSPILEDTFLKGRTSVFSSKSHDGSTEVKEYISQLKLDI